MTTKQEPPTARALVEPLLALKLDANAETHLATTRVRRLGDPANLVEPGPEDRELLPMHDSEPHEQESAPSRSNSQLPDILQPLVDLLGNRYPLSVLWELVNHDSPPCELSRMRFAPNEAAVAFFPVTLTSRAGRALATVLRLNGTDDLSQVDRHPESPLEFRIIRESRGCNQRWWRTSYLVADYDGELDVAAATRQVARLVAHLSNPNNLVTLTRKERANLF